jgi:hypothetical protein
MKNGSFSIILLWELTLYASSSPRLPAMCRPHWTLRSAEEDYGIRILGYIERGWDDHHDVLVIGKPGINE